MIGSGDNAFFFHSVYQRGSAVVADAEFALNVAGGRFFVILDDGDGLCVQILVGTGGKNRPPAGLSGGANPAAF